MKSAISADLCSRYESAGISLIIDKCSFLDPRFKVNFVADTDLVRSNLLTEMLEQRELPIHDQDHSLQATNQPPPQQESLEPTAPKKAKGLTAILSKLQKSNVSNQETVPVVTLEARAEKKLSNYLEQSCIDTDSNPLLWWKHNCICFPLLAVIARKYLCIPATSVPSEHVFSKGGIIVNAFILG